ncbi:quinol:electron acceptor oxidoreductase subunit ActD [Engelhardtia mirabilis]|uniref:Cytochrome c domain-containing protein n=1 Tax=Engelhardtia mirabilis TaxID=2528011 RepID=A0A518BH07_9BACT|nr:hypothetical protein Pla133_13370 [Planctomycetes bacterium Pla133]QDV00596.1 hypothetical protein Pla86_13360 [Planctomycetes bacterium Pla86]
MVELRFKNTSSEDPNWVRSLNEHDEGSEQKLSCVMAEYATPQEWLAACAKVRDAGYKRWDGLTPFPVHGMEEYIGIKPTILPWITLVAGMTGMTVAVALQYFTNAVLYPYLISGKPLFSLPANVPVMFELTVLFAAFTTVFTMLAMNGLPQWFHPLFRRNNFERMTDDRFGIVVEASDPKFNRQQVELLLANAGGANVEAIFEPAKRAPLPVVIHGVGLCVTVLALIPAGLAIKSRYVKSDKPRIHIIQDMDMQPKFKAQAPSPILGQLFGDMRASMPQVEGTVGRGQLREDDHYYRGRFGEGEEDYFDGIPPQALEHFGSATALLERGRERYGISCAPCHGLTGVGDGLVAQRADMLQQGTWVPPTSLHADTVVPQADGRIFETISLGRNNMKPYGASVKVADRWAIVAYVRALQQSQAATSDMVPPAELEALKD